MNEAEAARPQVAWAGVGHQYRYVGDGLPILPHATRLAATKAEWGYFRVQRGDDGGVLLIVNQQDYVPGKRHATSVQVTLSKVYSVLRDWLNAALEDD